MKRRILLIVMIAGMLGFSSDLFAQKAHIRDLVSVRGNRSNQLIGFGLVVGLQGTGDSKKALATNKAVANLMTRMGIKSGPEDVLSQSVAAVIVTAELPAFARNGDRFDVKVSVIGDAKSIAGGNLLQTPLKAGDGQVYAVAQGTVVTGMPNGSSKQVLTTALVPASGVVEREFAPQLVRNNMIELSLKNPDFTTNNRIAERINEQYKGFFAESLDPSTVRVNIPSQFQERVIEFVAEMEQLDVEASGRAVVVLNERTGTVVMGGQVAIGAIVVSHGDLSIQVNAGKDNKAPNQTVMSVGGATVGELVNSLNALGLRPSDLVGIVQAIHAAGALRADLKFL